MDQFDNTLSYNYIYFSSLNKAVKDKITIEKDNEKKKTLNKLKNVIEKWIYEDLDMSLDTVAEEIQELLKNIEGLNEFKKIK